MEDDGTINNEVHFVAVLATLVDGLAASKTGFAQVRRYAPQALIVEPLPRRPSGSKWKVKKKQAMGQARA